MQFRMDWWHRLWDWVPEKPDWWFAWRPVYLMDVNRWAWMERVKVREDFYEWKQRGIFDPGFSVHTFYYSLDYCD